MSGNLGEKLFSFLSLQRLRHVPVSPEPQIPCEGQGVVRANTTVPRVQSPASSSWGEGGEEKRVVLPFIFLL